VFPGPEHTYSIDDDELAEFRRELESQNAFQVNSAEEWGYASSGPLGG
jgi:hypothetical protein